jgi:hypothetical protein
VSRRLLTRIGLSGLLLALSACSEGAPISTAVPVVSTTDPPTLLPIPTDPTVPDTTLPAGAMFGGDFCTALTPSDLTSTSFRDFGTGALADTQAPSGGACSYTLTSGSKSVVVLVQMKSPDDFDAPPASNELVDAVAGIGLAAKAVNHGDTVELMVQMANGYFSVTTPDQASARRLAARAAVRA